AHEFDAEKTGELPQVSFAVTDAAASARAVFGVEAGTEDGRVADAAGRLKGVAAGAGDTGHVAAVVDCSDVDGATAFAVVRFEVGANVVIDRFAVSRPPVIATGGERALPVLPDATGAIGEQVLLGEALGKGEAAGTFADEEDAIGAVHDQAGDLAHM